MCVRQSSKKRSKPRYQSDAGSDVFDFNNDSSNLISTRQSAAPSSLYHSSETVCMPCTINDNLRFSKFSKIKVQIGSNDHCSCQLTPQGLNYRVHGSNLPSTCASSASSRSSYLSVPVLLSSTIGHSQRLMISPASQILPGSSELCSCPLAPQGASCCVHSSPSIVVSSSQIQSTSRGCTSGGLNGACDIPETNAMNNCIKCGLPNQVGESYDKRVGFSTSPLGRCVCNFVGISNAQNTKKFIAVVVS